LGKRSKKVVGPKPDAPRGIRNNNPGNIRISDADWMGKVKDNTDGAFEQFTHPKWGIRAMHKILQSYNKRGVDTVQEIIETWAPPVENKTQFYVAHICYVLDVRPTTPLNIWNPNVAIPLIQGIIEHENGEQPYSTAVIKDGLELAGVDV